MAGKIFINYRRDDSGGTAGRLHDRLAETFGRENLFMDVDHIPAGVDFVDYLPSQVAACDVFLAVIGPNWLDAKDDDGRRRFDNPADFVTIEITAALARNIRVIPVLVDGARTPKTDKLPDSIKPLVRRNAVEVRNTNFGRDAKALAEKVREALKTARPVTRRWPFTTSATERLWARSRWRMVAGSVTALLLVGWIGYQMGVPVWVPSMERMQRAAQPDPSGAHLLKAPSAVEEASNRPLRLLVPVFQPWSLLPMPKQNARPTKPSNNGSLPLRQKRSARPRRPPRRKQNARWRKRSNNGSLPLRRRRNGEN
jgi:hypothetical protein